MQELFILVALLGTSYFLFAERQFDISSIGYFSAVVYFAPGFFGEVLYPLERALIIGYPVQIHDQTFLVMTVVLLLILIPAIFFDAFYANKLPKFDITTNKSFTDYVVAFAIIGIIFTWAELGTEILGSADKNVVLERYSRWSILWTTGSTLAFVLAIEERRFSILAIALLGLGLEMYIGFRGSTAIAFLMAICLKLSASGKQRLGVLRWKLLTTTALGAILLLTYKKIFSLIKLGEWDLVFSLITDPTLYYDAFFHSEPFFTQSILNEVIINEFEVGLDHFASLIYSFILFAPELGLEIVGFNQLVQSQLFPLITDSGIAANIWAEMYSSGSWILLIIFALFFGISLCVGSYLMRITCVQVKACIALLFCTWAFFIHRNDAIFQITMEKRALMFVFLCWVCSRYFPIRAVIKGSRRIT